MSDPSALVLPAPRHWAPFSLKTLMLLMLLAAAFFGGWAVAWREAQQADEHRLLLAQVRQQLATAMSPVDFPTEIEAMLRLQAAAWNTGDLDRFMQHYWKSDELTFSAGGQTTRGWQNTLDRYKERYPSTAKMGQLAFDELHIHPLGEAAALVLGRWRLTRAGDMPSGNFSLVVQKLEGQWVIVHDHTSRTVPVDPSAGQMP